MKPLKVKVSITLDKNVEEKIKELADYDGRSFSQYINRVLAIRVKNMIKKGIISDDSENSFIIKRNRR